MNMQFANGVCATFTVTAFTQECCRTMRAMGSLGELEIDMLRNRVMLRRLGSPSRSSSWTSSPTALPGTAAAMTG